MEYGVGCIGSPISGNGAFSSNLNPPGSPGKSSIGSMSGFPSSGQVRISYMSRTLLLFQPLGPLRIVAELVSWLDYGYRY